MGLPKGLESVFPSGHVAVTLILSYYLATIFSNLRINKIFYLYPLTVSLYLFYNQEHFITDMLASLGIYMLVVPRIRTLTRDKN